MVGDICITIWKCSAFLWTNEYEQSESKENGKRRKENQNRIHIHQSKSQQIQGTRWDTRMKGGNERYMVDIYINGINVWR